MKNVEIIEFAEKNDCEGILRCLSEGYPVDETRSVITLMMNKMVGWDVCSFGGLLPWKHGRGEASC